MLRRLLVLPEIGDGNRPHASPFVRLMRPLTHPAIADKLAVDFAVDYNGERVDAVIVDRLWGPWITPWCAERLVRYVQSTGARLIYHMDDNLLDRRVDGGGWPTDRDIAVMEFFARMADGILVSTDPLAERLARYNQRIAVVPNALDERLIVGNPIPRLQSAFDASTPVVIGWMGTRTHDRDLAMVAPALHEIARRHGDRVRFECVGVMAETESQALLDGLDVRYLEPPAADSEYPQFMVWFTTRLKWDIGIAALADSEFTRGKSDLKYLDYAAIGAAGIFSRVEAYQTTIEPGINGWLTDNTTPDWVDGLDRLVVDAALRQRLTSMAAHDLYTRRILRHRAVDWVAAVDWLFDPTPIESGMPPARFGPATLRPMETAA